MTFHEISNENTVKSLPGLDPHVGDICPLAQVHMLGREQNPSPQLFLQIAEEEHRKRVTGINRNLRLKKTKKIPNSWKLTSLGQLLHIQK